MPVTRCPLPCALALAVATACASLAPAGPPLDPGPTGAGRLLLVFERDGERQLWTFRAGAARRVPVDAVREARWVAPDRIVAVLERPAGGDDPLPVTRLALVDPATGDTTPFGVPGRHHDAEPSPDGAYLAVGAEAAGPGDSDLEIWSLGDAPARIAVRHQSLEEPRWRPDGRALAASVLMPDPETDDDTGGGFAGTSLAWPRLHVVRRDLGDPQLLYDGSRPRTLAPGGTLALWWDERGLFARQRAGLVRCEPAADRCALVFAADSRRRVVDGRAVRARRDGAEREELWLLSVEAVDAFDRREPDRLHRVDPASGADRSLRTPPGIAIVDIDWIGSPAVPAPSGRDHGERAGRTRGSSARTAASGTLRASGSARPSQRKPRASGDDARPRRKSP